MWESGFWNCWIWGRVRGIFPTWGPSSTSQDPVLWPQYPQLVLIDYWDGTWPTEMKRILAELPGHSIKERSEGLKYGRWNRFPMKDSRTRQKRHCLYEGHQYLWDTQWWQTSVGLVWTVREVVLSVGMTGFQNGRGQATVFKYQRKVSVITVWEARTNQPSRFLDP